MQLHAAAARGDIEGVAYALQRGTPVDALDRSKSTALSAALQGGSSLPGAASHSNLAVLKLLLDAGAEIEKRDDQGCPPLLRAAGVSDPALLDELLARGADPRFVTKSGYTALVFAAYQSPSSTKLAMIDRLFALGVDINRETTHGETPISVCYLHGDFASLRHLLRLGADPAPLYWNKLHHAVAFG